MKVNVWRHVDCIFQKVFSSLRSINELHTLIVAMDGLLISEQNRNNFMWIICEWMKKCWFQSDITIEILAAVHTKDFPSII